MQSEPMTTPVLELVGVSKTFDSGGSRDSRVVAAVHGVTFAVQDREFVCLLGPSGSGKSTLLRIAGGLIAPDSGEVRVLGEPLREPRADVGFVFQTTNLMPWRSVLDNVLLPLEVRNGRVSSVDRSRAHELLALVGLDGFDQAYPRQLSGGMAQRVVLARTLIHEPRLLLMDEPFGALDALTRERMNVELLRVQQIHARSVLMVTHSISEAVFLADRVLVLSERPGTVAGEVAVPLPRPRDPALMGTEQFARLTHQVRRMIESRQLGRTQPRSRDSVPPRAEVRQ
jgi:NitT/TauT family transport system ATP-binding protein